MTRYTTGPESRFPGPTPLEPIFPTPPGGGGNHRIDAKQGLSAYWAYVITPDPLTIAKDGSSTPMPGSPSTLVPVSSLLPYTRVLVIDLNGMPVVVSRSYPASSEGVAMQWVDVEVLDGFHVREDNPDYRPQVLIDGSGLVDFRGQMGPEGLSNTVGAYTQILQLPDGYWPEAEVRWIGFPRSNPHSAYGGYISRADGGLYIRNDTQNNNWPPTEHWCIIVQPWKPVPAQPY